MAPPDCRRSHTATDDDSRVPPFNSRRPPIPKPGGLLPIFLCGFKWHICVMPPIYIRAGLCPLIVGIQNVPTIGEKYKMFPVSGHTGPPLRRMARMDRNNPTHSVILASKFSGYTGHSAGILKNPFTHHVGISSQGRTHVSAHCRHSNLPALVGKRKVFPLSKHNTKHDIGPAAKILQQARSNLKNGYYASRTFWQSLMIMAATWLRVAVPLGFSLPSMPQIRPVSTAQAMASCA